MFLADDIDSRCSERKLIQSYVPAITLLTLLWMPVETAPNIQQTPNHRSKLITKIKLIV